MHRCEDVTSQHRFIGAQRNRADHHIVVGEVEQLIFVLVVRGVESILWLDPPFCGCTLRHKLIDLVADEPAADPDLQDSRPRVGLVLGGGGAPTDAEYLVISADATLTDERIATGGTGIDIVDAGAGSTATFNLNIDSLATDTIAAADTIPFNDDGDNVANKITFANFEASLNFSKVVFSEYKEGTTDTPSTNADEPATAPTLDEMTHTFTPASATNKIEVFFSGTFENSKDNGTVVGIFVDGTLEASSQRSAYCGDDIDFPGLLSTVWQGTLSAVSHTIDVRFWVTNNGNSESVRRDGNDERSMLIREIAE